MIRSLLAITLIVLTGYGFVEAWPLLIGPGLTLASPHNATSYPGGLVTVSGKASRVALLTLDGTQLLRDENGSFSTTLTFPRGTSILTLVATDRFGRHVATTRSIFVPD